MTASRFGPGSVVAGLRLAMGMTFLALCELIPPGTASAAPPSVEFEPAAPSFGDILRQMETNLTLDIRVHNGTDSAFELRDVGIGCGCMSAEVPEPGAVAPGDAGTVRVTLDRKGVRPGRFAYPLTLMAANQPIASVQVAYHYDPAVAAEPTELFLDAEAGATSAVVAEATISVRRAEFRRGPAPRVECDNSSFAASLRKPPGASDGQYELQVTSLVHGLAIGNTEVAVALYLPGSETPDLVIPLHCMTRPPVVAHPATVVLKPVRRGRAVRRTFRLASRTPFTVASIESSSPEMKVAELPAPADARVDGDAMERVYELVIQPGDATAADTFEAEVRIEVKSPAKFRLVVPVTGEVVRDGSGDDNDEAR